MVSRGALTVGAIAVAVAFLAVPHSGATVIFVGFGLVVDDQNVTPPSALTIAQPVGVDVDVCYMDDSEDGAFDPDEIVLFHDMNRGGETHALDVVISTSGDKDPGQTVGAHPWVGRPLTCGSWPWPDAFRFHDGGPWTGVPDGLDFWILSADETGSSEDLVVAGPRGRVGSLLESGDAAWGAALAPPPGQARLVGLDADEDGAWSDGDALFLDHDADGFVSNGDIDWGPGAFGEYLAGSVRYGRVLEPAAAVPQFDVCGDDADDDAAWDEGGALYLHATGTDPVVAQRDVRLLLPEYKALVAGHIIGSGEYDLGRPLVCGVFDLGDFGWRDADGDGALDEDEAPVLARGAEVAPGDVVFDWEGRDVVAEQGHSTLGEPVLPLDMTRLRFVDQNGDDRFGRYDMPLLDRDVGTVGEERFTAGDMLLYVDGFVFNRDPKEPVADDGDGGPADPGDTTDPMPTTGASDATSPATDESASPAPDSSAGPTTGSSAVGWLAGVVAAAVVVGIRRRA